jgi:hypothetical protein
VVDVIGYDAYTDNPAGYAPNYAALRAKAPAKPFAMTEFGSGNPGGVDPNFDAWTIINLIKSGGMQATVYALCWTGWAWYQYRNGKAALADPYVLNRGNLGRPS